MARERSDITLLTPYTGGNLGDAAIQEAVIDNVRRRRPKAKLQLVTLEPSRTSRIHGVPSFPISREAAARERERVTDPISDSTPSSRKATVEPSAPHSLLRKTAKSVPGLYPALRWARRKASPIEHVVRTSVQEMRHMSDTYRLLKRSEILIVSGGGQLDEYWGGAWGHPYALLKWALLARAAGCETAFLSVGTCEIESRLSRLFIRRALRAAGYRSYRDQTSKTLLRDLAFTRDDAVYPDLAFSYVPAKSGCATSHGGVVGVSPIDYTSWPEQSPDAYARYLDAMTGLVEGLLERGHQVVLFHSVGLDRVPVDQMFERVLAGGHATGGGLTRADTGDLASFFDRIGKLDYIVASRLHGLLLSNLLAVPAIALSYDRKVDTYMSDLGLAEHCLDMREVQSEMLLSAFDDLVASSERIRASLEEIGDRYAAELQRQYDHVLRTALH